MEFFTNETILTRGDGMMFDNERFTNMIPFNEFNYWFIRTSATTFSYGLSKSFLSKKPVIEDTYDINNPILSSIEIQHEFKKFESRPEYSVGESVILNTVSATSNSPEHLIDCFEERIVGFIFIRALESGKNPDESFPLAVRFLDWIRTTDFYSCPGSTRFHDAEPHGLIFHTLNVYNNIIDLHKLLKFQSVNYPSSTIVSLCHDLTKIGNYELYMRNVKNEATGIWEQVPSYRWKDNPFPFGHGVTSMYIASQFFKLTMEEMIAIRWHMAEYRVARDEMGELEEACERYPLVRMVQFADQLACTKF